MKHNRYGTWKQEDRSVLLKDVDLRRQYGRVGLLRLLGGLLLGSLLVLGVAAESHAQSCAVFKKPEQVATVGNKDLTESSGLAASRRNPGVWWSHNDSGGKPRVYAFDSTGKDLGYFTVSGATNIDWEDMAAGPCPNGKPCLFIGDIGDNGRRRSEIVLYRVLEPPVANVKNQGVTGPANVFTLQYPDGAHDCEALLVHPKTRDVYLFTKENNGTTTAYRLPGTAEPGKHTLEKVISLNFTNDLVTGGDFSPSGDQIVLRGYTYGLVFQVDAAAIPLRGVKPTQIETGATIQGEAIAYATDGMSLWVTSERLPTPLIRVGCAEGSEPTVGEEPVAEEEPVVEEAPQVTVDASSAPDNQVVDNSSPQDTQTGSSCSCALGQSPGGASVELCLLLLFFVTWRWRKFSRSSC
ncbi:MAG: hypothetical protein EP343_03775 [Deltaproteobacteria bacterium]|nr:MAG: hypothetical protein EP343_03775 [Deltaproteobacteria bacterium]